MTLPLYRLFLFFDLFREGLLFGLAMYNSCHGTASPAWARRLISERNSLRLVFFSLSYPTDFSISFMSD